ncbi:MAG: phage tail assembly chaperone [Paracoccus sp. (in: a-proteobacteria)]|nr:phage tail assembly chaperone [Paracoccus sp. (in: a-proteobacteria)]
MTEPNTGRALDWPGLLRAGLCDLGLRPDEFWSMTPAELSMMLGLPATTRPMTRSRLADLAALYPDAPAAGRAAGARSQTGDASDGDG